jgi:hypothetical protein
MTSHDLERVLLEAKESIEKLPSWLRSRELWERLNATPTVIQAQTEHSEPKTPGREKLQD